MELPTTQLFASEITLAELTFGAYHSDSCNHYLTASVDIESGLSGTLIELSTIQRVPTVIRIRVIRVSLKSCS